MDNFCSKCGCAVVKKASLLEEVAEALQDSFTVHELNNLESKMLAQAAIDTLRKGAEERLGMYTMFSHDEPWIASMQEIIDDVLGQA